MLYPVELQAHRGSGRGREIRTPDILLPKQARYQTALYPVGRDDTHYVVSVNGRLRETEKTRMD